MRSLNDLLTNILTVNERLSDQNEEEEKEEA